MTFGLWVQDIYHLTCSVNYAKKLKVRVSRMGSNPKMKRFFSVSSFIEEVVFAIREVHNQKFTDLSQRR
jgi:hypothetical protein